MKRIAVFAIFARDSYRPRPSTYMPQQVQLNTDKCKVIFIHYQRYSTTGVEPHYVLNNSSLVEVVEIKDLGVH